ncbi:MAG: M1 family metallopeptidase [Acidobacteria bacterium]|nr:M1 family metallopeptidase [Acidobacteriota bacterium]
MGSGFHVPRPRVAALTVDQLDRRMSLRYAQPNAFSGFFDIDGDKFIATISADLMILEETDELSFGIGGNPRVRYVRDLDLDEDLPFQPFRSAFSRIYGFEDTFNSYRVKLDRVYKPGEIVRLKLSYNSPKLVRKLDEGFWRVERAGFLPFYEIIGDPAFMTFVMRTKDAYDHVAFGTERRREKRDGYLYTEWGAEHSVLFPTMNVGQFFPVETTEVDGIKILGYATKSAVITDLASPTKGMRQEVEKARSAMEGYQRMYALDYPFDNLKIVSVPKQFYAQAPTTILYMDEIFLQPKGLLGTALRIDSRTLSGTTAHEAGHQWWGGLVSNVNYLHYWFVEGFAELGSALYLESVDPGKMKVSLEGWRQDVFLSDHLCSLMDDWRQGGGVPAPPLRYTKGPYVFLMLGEHFGYDKLTEYMREIMKLHGGDLITTTDLQRIAERVFGVELDFYWKQWIRENGIPVVGYNLSRPREEGGKWVVDYKLTQRIERNGQVDAGRYFKMVVPMRVEKADGGYQTLKVWIDGPEKSGRLELPFRPKATPEIDPDLRMLFKRERL